MIYDKEIAAKRKHLLAIAPADPKQWSTHKFSLTSPGLLDSVLASREFSGSFKTTKKVCTVCGNAFYLHGDEQRNLCFECNQWATNERKRKKEQMNLFNNNEGLK